MSRALLGWALCAATMGIGSALRGLPTALVVHVVPAPLVFTVLSAGYFRRFANADPLANAASFLAVVGVLDVAIVALFVQRSLAMFGSFVGTWLPFALIFSATCLIGTIPRPRRATTGRD